MERPEPRPADRKRHPGALISVAVFLALSLAVSWYVGRPLAAYANDPAAFRVWIDSFGAWSRLVFVGIIMLQVVVAIIPGGVFEVAGGYAFGTVQGTLLSVIGLVAGSAIVFALVRRWGVQAIEFFFPREKIEKLKIFRDPRRLNIVAFVVFLIPGTPKDLLSYCVGLTGMRFSAWMAISALARFPAVLVSALAGDHLGRQQYREAILIGAAAVVLSAVGLWIYGRIGRGSETTDAGDAG